MFASIWVFHRETSAVVAERHWKGATSARTTAKLCVGWGKTVQAQRPYYVVRVQKEELKAVAAAMEEFPPAAAVELLERILEEMERRKDPVERQLLLDEMMDGGLPDTTQLAELQVLFPEEDLVQRVSTVLLGNQKNGGQGRALPWRRANVSHLKHEFLLDVVERVDATVNREGRHENVNVVGSVVANSRLSGLPDMRLTFSNPDVMGACNLHPCVRLKPFLTDRTVSFVPPDGQFTLMSYTTEAAIALDTAIPLYVRLQTAPDACLPGLKVNMVVGFKPSSLKSLDGVRALFQLPPHILRTDFSTNCGTLHMDMDARTCSWDIGTMDHTRTPCLTGTVAWEAEGSVDRMSFSPTVQLSFSYVHSSLSGLAIQSLKLMNEPQQPFRGVRFVVRSGSYEVCL